MVHSKRCGAAMRTCGVRSGIRPFRTGKRPGGGFFFNVDFLPPGGHLCSSGYADAVRDRVASPQLKLGPVWPAGALAWPWHDARISAIRGSDGLLPCLMMVL